MYLHFNTETASVKEVSCRKSAEEYGVGFGEGKETLPLFLCGLFENGIAKREKEGIS